MSAAQAPLLIVEDDRALQKQIKWSLDRFETVTACDRESALVQARRHQPSVVTMDLGLPPDPDSVGEGFRLLEQLLQIDPDIKVIVLTGQNDQANALRAVALGAYDFFAKPFEPELLGLTIDRAFRLFELQAENRRLQTLHQPDALTGLLTRDPEMLRLCRMIERVASSDATVMLLGESGTGKEVLAQGLHQASKRSGRFVAINCAAIPEALLESELFGHEKGSFTGASKTTVGKIERIGGRQEIAVDVRVVCATHQNLLAQIEVGRFREDLYYRLAEIVVEIPALRERPGDAVLLAQAFLRRFAQESRRPAMAFSDEAMRALDRHRWPGNVRELLNKVKRASIMADGGRVGCEDLGLAAAGGDAPQQVDTLDLRQVRDRAERGAVIAALGRTNGNLVKAAELLGVSRPTLYDLMNKLAIRQRIDA